MKQRTYRKIESALGRKMRNILVYWHYPEILTLPHTKTFSDEIHLAFAIDWIKNAFHTSHEEGIPAFYNLLDHTWGQSYRETTGYIIPTLLDYHAMTGDKELLRISIKLGEWEIRNQSADGAIGEILKDGSLAPKVFNTGQVLLGYCALHDKTGEQKYLAAAEKGCEWLIQNQDPSGSWEKFSNSGGCTIDTRVAFALLSCFKINGQVKNKTSALKFLDWAISRQRENGWFESGSLRDAENPWTHAIAYTISGLLESSRILNDENMFKSAYKASEALLNYYEKKVAEKEYLPGSFNRAWQSSESSYSCLTGNAQIAIDWFKIYEKTREKRFLDAAIRATEDLKRLHLTKSRSPSLRGGLTGSYPISGNYAAFKIPNWAVKFFADALILKLGNAAEMK